MEGYFRDNPNVTVLASFRAIGPIARRADFQKLVKEIEGKKYGGSRLWFGPVCRPYVWQGLEIAVRREHC